MYLKILENIVISSYKKNIILHEAKSILDLRAQTYAGLANFL